MSRIVYVNGEFLPETDAKISVFDRGFLMADGVYEVTTILTGRWWTMQPISRAFNAPLMN